MSRLTDDLREGVVAGLIGGILLNIGEFIIASNYFSFMNNTVNAAAAVIMIIGAVGVFMLMRSILKLKGGFYTAPLAFISAVAAPVAFLLGGLTIGNAFTIIASDLIMAYYYMLNRSRAALILLIFIIATSFITIGVGALAAVAVYAVVLRSELNLKRGKVGKI